MERQRRDRLALVMAIALVGMLGPGEREQGGLHGTAEDEGQGGGPVSRAKAQESRLVRL